MIAYFTFFLAFDIFRQLWLLIKWEQANQNYATKAKKKMQRKVLTVEFQVKTNLKIVL